MTILLSILGSNNPTTLHPAMTTSLAILVHATTSNSSQPDCALYDITKLPEDVLERIRDFPPNESSFEKLFYGTDTMTITEALKYVAKIEAAKTPLRSGHSIPAHLQVSQVLFLTKGNTA